MARTVPVLPVLSEPRLRQRPCRLRHRHDASPRSPAVSTAPSGCASSPLASRSRRLRRPPRRPRRRRRGSPLPFNEDPASSVSPSSSGFCIADFGGFVALSQRHRFVMRLAQRLSIALARLAVASTSAPSAPAPLAPAGLLGGFGRNLFAFGFAVSSSISRHVVALDLGTPHRRRWCPAGWRRRSPWPDRSTSSARRDRSRRRDVRSALDRR